MAHGPEQRAALRALLPPDAPQRQSPHGPGGGLAQRRPRGCSPCACTLAPRARACPRPRTGACPGRLWLLAPPHPARSPARMRTRGKVAVFNQEQLDAKQAQCLDEDGGPPAKIARLHLLDASWRESRASRRESRHFCFQPRGSACRVGRAARQPLPPSHLHHRHHHHHRRGYVPGVPSGLVPARQPLGVAVAQR